jgi:asparagine synthase (glutamine-hydrolysing)
MCGIAGFWSDKIDAAAREAAVSRMQNAMLHRGPDEGGRTTCGSLTLGMRRLAIFDPKNGHQPMRTSDGRYELVFNGAIYNHRQLQQELIGLGHEFKTECDTEVLLEAWSHWGQASLSRLRGMFAFAVWDHTRQSLHLVRDPLGIKPLYYSEQGGNLLFASELNAIRASDYFDATIDPTSVDAFLRNLAVPVPRTIYRHAQSLRPAEIAEWREGRLKIESYWNFPAASEKHACSAPDFTAGLREQLNESIAMHRLADVPVGAFLSGGLDSAVIVGLISQSSSTRLKTFSIGFEESAFSEAAAAAETAKHFGTDHQAITLTGKEAADKLPSFLAALDQPTGDGFNTFVVAQAARAGGVAAALSGLGGDELFGGYPQFRHTPQIARWLPFWLTLPQGLRGSICNRLGRGSTRSRRLADILRQARDLHDVADRQRQVLSDDARAQILTHPSVPEVHPAQAELREALMGNSPAEVVSAWELRTYMSDVLLRDSDVFSMRASLELRVPFVDRPLLEWLWQNPSAHRFDPRHPKGALVSAVADILPPGLMNRRKQGFSFPFAQWMRGPLLPFIEDTLTSTSIGQSGLLNPTKVQSYWHRFRDGADDKEWSRVWSLTVFIAFLNQRTSN